MSEWKDIATAPKDGTHFLAWGFMHDDGGMHYPDGSSFMGEWPWIGEVFWDRHSFIAVGMCSMDGLIEWRPLPTGDQS